MENSAMKNSAMGDSAMENLTMKDLEMKNLTIKDLEMKNLTIKDLAMEDLKMEEDLAITPKDDAPQSIGATLTKSQNEEYIYICIISLYSYFEIDIARCKTPCDIEFNEIIQLLFNFIYKNNYELFTNSKKIKLNKKKKFLILTNIITSINNKGGESAFVEFIRKFDHQYALALKMEYCIYYLYYYFDIEFNFAPSEKEYYEIGILMVHFIFKDNFKALTSKKIIKSWKKQNMNIIIQIINKINLVGGKSAFREFIDEYNFICSKIFLDNKK